MTSSYAGTAAVQSSIRKKLEARQNIASADDA
jgi:hypothetical protein